jgi:hypothetical protein
MVPVLRVADGFTARVVAARLGSEGVMTQLRGGGIDSPYPMGDVEVLVPAEDLDLARELLLADEVESSFEPYELLAPPRRRWPVVAGVLVAAALVIGDVVVLLRRGG